MTRRAEALRRQREALRRDARDTADSGEAFVIGPEGARGLTLIEYRKGSGIQVVATAPAGQTWKPGTKVPVLFPNGDKSRPVIVSDPAPGARNSGNFPPPPPQGPPADPATLSITSVTPALQSWTCDTEDAEATVTGVGFTESSVLSVYVVDGDPSVILAPSVLTTYVSSTELTMSFSAANSEEDPPGVVTIDGGVYSVRVTDGSAFAEAPQAATMLETVCED